MRIHRRSAILAQLRLRAPDLALEHLRQERRHVRMDHRREQLLRQRRVPEALPEAVPRVVRALRVHVRRTQLVLRGDVVVERGVELPRAVDLEREDDQDRGDGRDPV